MAEAPSGAWWARAISTDHWLGRTLLAARARADLALWRPATQAERALKAAMARVSPAYTMVAVERLKQLAAHAVTVHGDRIAGAVVECGTWRGGSLALMDWVLRELEDPRPLWGFDSFEGLPAPGGRDPIAAHRGFFRGWCAASPDDVRAAIRALDGPAGRLHLVGGWLDQTLPRTETGPIALLNIDVDWYESVQSVFVQLFDRMSPGGIINIDDYGRWSGCDQAVHDFLESRGLPLGLIQRTERHGAWFRVPSDARETGTSAGDQANAFGRHPGA
jgi:O-methyltransferase